MIAGIPEPLSASRSLKCRSARSQVGTLEFALRRLMCRLFKAPEFLRREKPGRLDDRYHMVVDISEPSIPPALFPRESSWKRIRRGNLGHPVDPVHQNRGAKLPQNQD